MTRAAAKTGIGPMVLAAIEQHEPPDRRIIDDHLATLILPMHMRAFVWLLRPTWARAWMVRTSDQSIPGLWGGLLCRKRYIDEQLLAAHGQIQAVVNLGAGFDTRAYRLPALANIPMWEVDQLENITPKRARLQNIFGQIPRHVTLVPIDFDQQDLGAVLAAHGYRMDTPTFFIWEAVSQYLTEAGVRTTFDFLAQSAPGSRLVFTYVRQDFIAGQVLYGQERLYQQYVVRDKLWHFGLAPDEVSPFLDQYGWRVVEHLGYEDLAERYVRPLNRGLASTPIERIVAAEKR
ncbi:MAG TPA: SAM-dependent methyltransferase [Herpetosiphonaceae bacterium]